MSSGISSSSTRLRTKSKSVFDADGKPTSISLMPSRDEQVEHRLLARRVHRLHERLVAVAEVGRAPDRRAVEHDVGPGPVGQVDGLVRAIFPVRHRHGCLLGEGGLLPCVREQDRYVESLVPLTGEGGGRARAQEGGGARAGSWREHNPPRESPKRRAAASGSPCRSPSFVRLSSRHAREPERRQHAATSSSTAPAAVNRTVSSRCSCSTPTCEPISS